MLDYDTEADRYDASRGGVPRAGAAARAVLGLLPPDVRTLLDVGCGTGLVSARISRPGLRVAGADASPGMLRLAAARLGGAVVLADARRLPFADGTLDAVSAVWLLHLLPDAAPVVAECARVLRPGGVLVATVDKDASHDVGSDIDALLAPFRRPDASDGRALVAGHAARHGLRPCGGASFTGHGQGRSPRSAAAGLAHGAYPSAIRVTERQAASLAASLAALPDQDRPRPDPVYRLVALRKDV
ncbi:class I SAM-dependent methyltransferase [Streptacidiphilus sp. ASG 303]|uniref:class I SAM-dependent methyltransferase n=1 Tax=Streptacidiphilus sp. ASG 303 TaxID=2896847 RepID=UPI001E652087|nr:class I SAM-dependent methyltransferase [Streptacidiphilus sp. ASG 303]MCD0483835.1 class I SAM-dependent methyltransferase [Streptacidiphilus sp. ASG 303]